MITSASTHMGNVRTMNQDAFLIFQMESSSAVVAAVADGMGGHRAGNIASLLALETVRDFCDANPQMDEIALGHGCVKSANEAVYRRALADVACTGMGTTLCMGQFYKDNVTIAHVGDSRMYSFTKKDGLMQITHDHSLVQELVDMGRINQEEATVHPQRNVITRAIGTTADVTGDVFKVAWEKDEIYLICSDGLSGEVPPEQIDLILRSDFSLQQKVELLIQTALGAGGTDNITVILIQNSDDEVRA